MGFLSRLSLRSLEFDTSAFEDLAWWIEQDRAQALRIVRFVREVQREPFSGLGKPEPLKARALRLLVAAYQSRTPAGISSLAGQGPNSFLPFPLLMETMEVFP